MEFGTTKMTFYSACGISEGSRKVLLNIHGTARPQHVFGSVLDRLPSRTREHLLKEQGRVLELWSHCKAEHADGGINKVTLRKQHGRLASRYLSFLEHTLGTVEFESTAYCYVHGRQCPLTPRAQASLREDLWIEAAGTRCDSFSTIGESICLVVR